MNKFKIIIGIINIGLISLTLLFFSNRKASGEREKIELPKPRYKSEISVEEAIFRRQSVRNYLDEPLNLEEVSQLLWAVGGITCDGVTGATRAYPSAGATYPLEMYVVIGSVKGIEPGVYSYLYRKHEIVLVKKGDLREELTEAAFGQSMVRRAPISIIFTAVFTRTTGRYGKRGDRYVLIDLGHTGQNLYLQAEALGLGTVAIGAFRDEIVRDILGLNEEQPLYIMPVGKKAK